MHVNAFDRAELAALRADAVASDREERRDALRRELVASGCGHDYGSNRRGGGTCRDCGDELDRDEL